MPTAIMTSTSTSKPSPKSQSPSSNTNDSPSLPSLKNCASSDPSLRRNALNTVLSHIATLDATFPLSETQWLQIWRSFSVVLYMHDTKNMLSVQKLIQTLASTIATMYDKDVELFLSTRANARGGSGESVEFDYPWTTPFHKSFWETLCREWSGIDQWRMNKYLSLVRMWMRKVFEICLRRSAHQISFTRSQIQVLSGWPLSTKQRKVSDGLRLHVLDLWLEELQKARDGARLPAADDSEIAIAPTESQSASPGGRKRKRQPTDDQGRDDAERKEAEQAAAGTDTSHSDDQIISHLMRPIGTLAKDALSKAVRVKAKEVIAEFENSNPGAAENQDDVNDEKEVDEGEWAGLDEP